MLPFRPSHFTASQPPLASQPLGPEPSLCLTRQIPLNLSPILHSSSSSSVLLFCSLLLGLLGVHSIVLFCSSSSVLSVRSSSSTRTPLSLGLPVEASTGSRCRLSCVHRGKRIDKDPDKVLMLLPLASIALRVVKRLIQLNPPANKIRGVQNLIIYALPERKEFYQEIVNMLKGSVNMTCTVLFSCFDQFQLERIVGSAAAKRMLSSDKGVFVVC